MQLLCLRKLVNQIVQKIWENLKILPRHHLLLRPLPRLLVLLHLQLE
jgi:hypothetical protein